MQLVRLSLLVLFLTSSIPVALAGTCSAQKLSEILAYPGFDTAPVLIDCDASLRATDIIRKQVLFDDRSNGVTLDCNGGQITPAMYYATTPDLEVTSRRTSPGNYLQARDITIRNCEINGTIVVASTYYTAGLTGASGVSVKRSTSPTRITFDSVTIHNDFKTNTFYIEQGATYAH